MNAVPPDDAAAKRERIKAISRTVHSIPVEEGGQLRPVRLQLAEPAPRQRFFKRRLVAAGSIAGVMLGLAAVLLAGRRR